MEDSLVKQQIHEARKAVDQWEKELFENKDDLRKFYKKGNKRAGMRVRKVLMEMITQAKLMRADIIRTNKEAVLFKGKK